MRLVISAIFSLLVMTRAGYSADICQAIALRDVPALEDSQSIIKKGDRDDAITQYRVNKRTGDTSFCSHGGYCYPTHVVVGGDKLEALKLTNCTVGQISYEDNEEITYSIDPIRSKIPPEQLKIDDVDNKLLDLGLCSACAGNIAMIYVHRPKSKCAELTRSALEGSPEALQALQEFPDFCKYN